MTLTLPISQLNLDKVTQVGFCNSWAFQNQTYRNHRPHKKIFFEMKINHNFALSLRKFSPLICPCLIGPMSSFVTKPTFTSRDHYHITYLLSVTNLIGLESFGACCLSVHWPLSSAQTCAMLTLNAGTLSSSTAGPPSPHFPSWVPLSPSDDKCNIFCQYNKTFTLWYHDIFFCLNVKYCRCEQLSL